MTTATHAELYAGSTTEAGFLETAAGRVFYVTERPHELAAFAVLIATPLFSERLKNNRREVLLSRALAAAGVPTVRFHYLDTGNSDDSPTGPTTESLIASTNAAAEHLAETTNLPIRAVVGTRLAATVLAHADHGAPYYSVWDPVHKGSSWLREVLRTRIIVAMKGGNTVSQSDLDKIMERDGEVDIVGFSINASLAESVKDFALPTDDQSIKALQVTLFRQSELGGAERRALEAWAPNLDSPMSVTNDVEESWWFHQNTNLLPDDIEETYEATVQRVAEWILRVGGAA